MFASILTPRVFVDSLRESLGISADGSEKLYRGDEIEEFEKRDGQKLVWFDRDHTQNVQVSTSYFTTSTCFVFTFVVSVRFSFASTSSSQSIRAGGDPRRSL